MWLCSLILKHVIHSGAQIEINLMVNTHCSCRLISYKYLNMLTLSDTCSGRRQYLVTYSQVDPGKFPNRESFAAMLEEEFNARTSAVKVTHWACCREPHENDGFHYHCAIKLTGTKKWISVKHRVIPSTV